MTSPAPRRVLLAGFSPDFATWLGGRLPGVIVATAATGEETVAVLRGGGWAAAAVDQDVAAAPGWDLLQAVRMAAAREACPVLFCLDPDCTDRLRESLDQPSGSRGFLCRPLDREELARELASLLGVDLLPPMRAVSGASAAIAQLWERFHGMMFARLVAIEEVAHAAAEGRLSEGLRREGEREAHKLVGALGTYGLGEGSRIAREVEHLLGGSDALPPEAAGRLVSLGASLRRVMEEFGGPRPVGAEDQPRQ